jgi:hypothetical protein
VLLQICPARVQLREQRSLEDGFDQLFAHLSAPGIEPERRLQGCFGCLERTVGGRRGGSSFFPQALPFPTVLTIERRESIVPDEQAALLDRGFVAGDDQLGFPRIEDVRGREAGGVLAPPVEDGFGAAIGKQVSPVADAFDDQRHRNIVDDQFEDRWQAWLGDPDTWDPFFDELTVAEPSDLLSDLAARDLISPQQTETIQALRRSAEGRAVHLTGEHALDDDLITLLAAGFAKGEPRAPAIPYAKLAAA